MAGVGARRERERGAAAVEFALVAPILLLLVFGIISYGYMLSFRQALSQAAAEGARAAAVEIDPDSRESEALAAVAEALDSYGVECGTGAMTCTAVPETCGTATCIRVTVSYDYADDPLMPELPGIGLVMPDALAYESVARVS